MTDMVNVRVLTGVLWRVQRLRPYKSYQSLRVAYHLAIPVYPRTTGLAIYVSRGIMVIVILIIRLKLGTGRVQRYMHLCSDIRARLRKIV